MILHPHSPIWVREFHRLKENYDLVLGSLITRIEHVGSTAIRGISAKPILDVDLVISTKADFPPVKEELEKIGYQHVGDLGILDREAFKRKDKRVPLSNKTNEWMEHHLYVCVDGTRELKRHTSFRDYLNGNEDARIEYETIKKDIERQSGGDREVYVEIKENGRRCTEFIERILKKAEQGSSYNSGQSLRD